jgi:hypothetical protein
VVSRDVIKVLARCLVSAPNCARLRGLRHPSAVLVSGKIADIDGDVPVKWRRAFLPPCSEWRYGLGKRFAFSRDVRAHVRIAYGPEAELSRSGRLSCGCRRKRQSASRLDKAAGA